MWRWKTEFSSLNPKSVFLKPELSLKAQRLVVTLEDWTLNKVPVDWPALSVCFMPEYLLFCYPTYITSSGGLL